MFWSMHREMMQTISILLPWFTGSPWHSNRGMYACIPKHFPSGHYQSTKGIPCMAVVHNNNHRSCTAGQVMQCYVKYLLCPHLHTNLYVQKPKASNLLTIVNIFSAYQMHSEGTIRHFSLNTAVGNLILFLADAYYISQLYKTSL